VSPLWGEKPQNWPLSKLNTGRFALCAMLPVMKQEMMVWQWHQLGHIQVNCTLLQTDNHTSQHLITQFFLQTGCSS